ncbi:MAG TPA: hypothetical protein VH643_18640 [Gemmataceae bacterium]|jgi:hypothetical protein
MNRQPKTGDRVRLTTRDFEPDYWPGDRGTVLSGPHPIPSGGHFYVVTLDKDGPTGTGITINANEIELDAAAMAS